MRRAPCFAPYLTTHRRAVLAATVSGVAVAALIVAIVAVVVAVFAAAYARTQALAAKGSLAIEQARHEAELTPRFEAAITRGDAAVLQLRLLPGQLPMTGVGLRIVEGADEVRFDSTGYWPHIRWGGNWASQREGVLLPGEQGNWPLKVDHDAYGVTLEVSDLGRPGRVAAVTVPVPPRR